MTNRAQSIVGDHKEGRPFNDFYPTPANAVHKLMKAEEFPVCIWECACGDGAISKILKNSFNKSVISTDITNRGFGEGGVDFLLEQSLPFTYDCAIITNPPFYLLEEFIQHAIRLGPAKIALLAKLTALEGVTRSALLMFRRRIEMSRDGLDAEPHGMLAFAWFIWERGYKGAPEIGWI